MTYLNVFRYEYVNWGKLKLLNCNLGIDRVVAGGESVTPCCLGDYS